VGGGGGGGGVGEAGRLGRKKKKVYKKNAFRKLGSQANKCTGRGGGLRPVQAVVKGVDRGYLGLKVVEGRGKKRGDAVRRMCIWDWGGGGVRVTGVLWRGFVGGWGIFCFLGLWWGGEGLCGVVCGGGWFFLLITRVCLLGRWGLGGGVGGGVLGIGALRLGGGGGSFF